MTYHRRTVVRGRVMARKNDAALIERNDDRRWGMRRASPAALSALTHRVRRAATPILGATHADPMQRPAAPKGIACPLACTHEGESWSPDRLAGGRFDWPPRQRRRM